MRRRDVAAALAVLALPRVAWAQRVKVPVVGVLVLGSPPPDLLLTVFRDALRQRGYVEGQTIALAVRSAGGKSERLPEMAAELVNLRVDIIVAWQTPATAAAKVATRDIPIVMAGAADPIGNGFIASLSRPGGNITGISGAAEVFGKGVELLREVVPRARRFAVLANAIDPFSPAFERLLETSAQGAGVQLLVNKVRPSDDLREAFAEFAKLRVDGLIVQPSLLSQAVADLALQHRLPSIAGFRTFAENGGLMSYSGNQSENFEQAARYVDLILKGAKPAELPAAHATKFELVINLKTAKALGIVVPQTLLIRADELIE